SSDKQDPRGRAHTRGNQGPSGAREAARGEKGPAHLGGEETEGWRPSRRGDQGAEQGRGGDRERQRGGAPDEEARWTREVDPPVRPWPATPGDNWPTPYRFQERPQRARTPVQGQHCRQARHRRSPEDPP